jgi:hypothetical protein
MNMTNRKLMFVALCSALTAAAAGVSAMPETTATKEACVFSKYEASTVTPFTADENFGYGSYTALKGAQVFVPAREGLTEQWLAREVQSALATRGASSCQSTVRDVKVQVVSGGPGFWVQLIAADEQQGKQLLQWAKGLVSMPAKR